MCQRDHQRASHYTTLRNYDISSKRHLGFKFQNNTLDSILPRVRCSEGSFWKDKIQHGGDGGGFDVFCLAQLTLELETVYQDLKHFVCFDFLYRDR